MLDGYESGMSRVRESCKSTELKRCIATVICWNKYELSGRQPDVAALNSGRHLYSAWRPSRSALAHILVIIILLIRICVENLSVMHISA